jgi:transposase-like protein
VEEAPKRRRRSFTKAKKMEILREISSGSSTLSDLARKYDIHPVTIYSWKRNLREQIMKKPEEPDIAAILKENEKLKLKVSALEETVSDLAVRKRILECSNDIYKRDALKKKLSMQKTSSKNLKKKKK